MNEQFGYELASGAAKYFARIFLLGLLFWAAINFTRNQLGWGLDSTDLSGWERSGLHLHTDHKTGIQYLSDGKGGLTPRLWKEDRP